MNESESGLVVSDSLRPYRLYSPWNSPGQNTGVDSLSLLQGIFPIGTEPRSPSLQADSLSAEPQGKPKNTGEGSLSLLQRIFLTQESNQGLLHCRRILYQLSYQGSPQEEQWDLQSWILPNKFLPQINTHIQTPQHLRSTGKGRRKENENIPCPVSSQHNPHPNCTWGGYHNRPKFGPSSSILQHSQEGRRRGPDGQHTTSRTQGTIRAREAAKIYIFFKERGRRPDEAECSEVSYL